MQGYSLSLLLLATVAATSTGQDYEPLQNSVILDEFGFYVMSWTPEEKHVIFEVQVCRTKDVVLPVLNEIKFCQMLYLNSYTIHSNLMFIIALFLFIFCTSGCHPRVHRSGFLAQRGNERGWHRNGMGGREWPTPTECEFWMRYNL